MSAALGGFRTDRRRRHSDDLSPSLRRALFGAIAALHVLAAYALLQVGSVREAVREAAPLFAVLITDAPKDTPPAPSVAPPRRVTPDLRQPPPLIAAVSAPSAPAPAFTVPTPPADAVPAAEVPAVPTAMPAPAPVPAPTVVMPPRTLAATEVGYLEAPRVGYPPVSRRLGEQGRVLLRVLVDPQGLPAQVVVSQSSGHARLDDAATTAARRTRFRPYTDNGVAQTVWVLLPIAFTLENM